MKNISHCLLALTLTVIIFVSCQKEVNFQGPISKTTGFDSTQLIKSIKLIYQDGLTEDSIIESYSYDTVNRKITLSWASSNPNDDDLNGSSAVYSYNSKGLLTGIAYNYAGSYTPIDQDYTSISLSYDNEDVLKTVVLNFVSSPTITKNYGKATGGAGYSLNWENKYTDPGSPEFIGDKQINFFDGTGKCTIYEKYYIKVDVNNDTSTVIGFRDSLIYTAAGSLQKVYNLNPNRIAPQPNTQILKYEFESRYDKGDELGKQRQLLFKGLDNMEFEESDNWFYTSILTDTPSAYEFDQFTPFPFKTARVYDIDNNVQVPFTSEASFDNLNRLVSFKGFFDDGPLLPRLYKITYYK